MFAQVLSGLSLFMGSEKAICPLDGVGGGVGVVLHTTRATAGIFHHLSTPLTTLPTHEQLANLCHSLASGPTVHLCQGYGPLLQTTDLLCVFPSSQ